MIQNFKSIPRPSIFALAKWQILTSIIVITVVAVLNSTWVSAAIFGCLICLIPSVYFAYRAFKYQGAKNAVHIAQSFYRAEAGKFLLTIAGFAMVFSTSKDVRVDVLFASYLAVLFAGLISNYQQTLRK